MSLNLDSRSLVLCVPQHCSSRNHRLNVVASAMKRAASELGLSIESVYKRNLLSVSVIFKTRNEENWVYSDWKKDWDEDLIYKTIRSLAWALNFERILIASAGT